MDFSCFVKVQRFLLRTLSTICMGLHGMQGAKSFALQDSKTNLYRKCHSDFENLAFGSLRDWPGDGRSSGYGVENDRKDQDRMLC